MADRRASAFVFVLVVAAVAAGGWFLFRGSVPHTVPEDGGGKATPSPAPGPNPHAGPSPAIPLEGIVAPTREACLGFLSEQAGPPRLPKGGGPILLFSAVRMDALDALAAVAPEAAGPAVLAALGGDGNAGDWSEERLHAAGIRIRAGQPDGAQAVAAYLREAQDIADSDATVEAARAAAALPPAEGAGVVRRILAEKADDLTTEVLAAALQAAAALGDGASPEELAKHLSSEEWLVRGAAAGALLRRGDSSALKAGEGVEWPDSEEFALGLGVPGNEAALPALEEVLRAEESFARAAAARAVGTVGGPKAIALLRGALKDPDAEVRTAAAVALLLLGQGDDLEAARRGTSDRDPEIAVAAWKALALAGDAGSREAAAALLTTPPPPPKDGTRGIALQKRIWAAALVVRTSK